MLHLRHQETPSRILRRIQEAENDSDMPSLPSMASTDGSEDEDENRDASAVKSRRTPRADMTSFSSAGRGSSQGKSRKSLNSHQNKAATGNNNNNASGRNILSPLKLNGRQSPVVDSNSIPKGKGRATSQDSPTSRSPGPLSAVSSNRTVRPISQSPHDFRGTSVTPSIHVTNRLTKATQRMQSISFDDSTLPPAADHSDQQQQQEQTEQSHGVDQSLSKSLNLDFSEDSGFPERPALETSLWSHRSEGNSSNPPASSRKVAFQQELSSTSRNGDNAGDDVSLPFKPSSESNEDTYDYTTGSPTTANAYTRPQAANLSRRGSTSSSASGSTSEIPQIQVTPAPAPMARARRVLIRSSSFDQAADDSVGTTPGMGRRLPSAERKHQDSPSYMIDSKLVESNTETVNDTTPSRSSHGTPTSAIPSTAITSRAYSYSNTPEALATPKASATDADLERRKMHLLSTLRMTALKSTKKGLRLARGTPHPRDRRARSVTPAIEEEDSTAELDASAARSAQVEDMTAMSGSSTLSNGSSNDLTTNPRGHGNTSLPLAGLASTAEGGIVAASRFNNAKLNNYLHTLNSHLTAENQNLIKTLEETAKEVTRLVRRNEELSGINVTNDNSAGQSGQSMLRKAEDEEGDATREILQSHRRTSQDISHLREHLTGSTSSKPSAQILAELQEKDARLQKREADLAQRDAEIAAMRADILKQSKSANRDESQAETDADLHQQIFNLRDELSSVKAENSVYTNDLAKMRAEQLEQSSRHNKAIADLQARTDDLLSELEEKDAIIEEIENELVKQEEDFRMKMSNLEEELCKVMEEQEVQLREARKEIQQLKEASPSSVHSETRETAELRNKMQSLEQELSDLSAAKAKADAMLQEATAAIAHADKSAERPSAEQIAFLQKRLDGQQEALKQKDEQLSNLREEMTELQKQHDLELEHLQNEVNDLQDAKAQLERKLTSQAVLLKETEKAFADSEDNVRETAEELEEGRRQLQELQDEISSLKNEQLVVMTSDLQKKYDAAMREIGNLKHQLAYPPVQNRDAAAGKFSKHDSRELEIKTLRSSNHELETRVGQLRKQAMLAAGQSPSNRSTSSMATPCGTEKSVRFDSVRSMKTPRSASQLLGGMSWLDKTGNSSAANATASPLYAEIDNLNRDIKQYKHLLQSANDDIDDKLRKLDSAGTSVISMAKELELARRRIRDLESGTGASSDSAVVQELRAVRDELTNERSNLMRRLKDIQEQCRQMATQLDASRSAQSDTQRKLDWQTAQLHRLQGNNVSTFDGEVQLCMDPAHQEMAAERDAIFAGVAALKRDLTKVQQDALELGQDLHAAKAGGPARFRITAPGSSDCTKTSCLALQARSKQEAKGLLLMISHLKAKFTRESYFRADLAHQKLYLSLLNEQKQKSINATSVTLERFGLPPAEVERRPRMSLKIAAHAVIAVIRMDKASSEWRKQSAVKTSLRNAYKHTKGKPFVPAAYKE